MDSGLLLMIILSLTKVLLSVRTPTNSFLLTSKPIIVICGNATLFGSEFKSIRLGIRFVKERREKRRKKGRLHKGISSWYIYGRLVGYLGRGFNPSQPRIDHLNTGEIPDARTADIERFRNRMSWLSGI